MELTDSEIQVAEMVQQLFSNPYQAPNTIKIELTDSANSDFSKDDVINFYLDVAHCGLKYLYGKDKTATDLSFEEFFKLDQYMKSIGVTLKTYIMTIDGDRLDISPFEYTEPEKIMYIGIYIEFLN